MHTHLSIKFFFFCSNESSCEYYNWDYEMISKMNVSEALEEYGGENSNREKPELIPCSRYDYEKGLSSMVIDVSCC